MSNIKRAVEGSEQSSQRRGYMIKGNGAGGVKIRSSVRRGRPLPPDRPDPASSASDTDISSPLFCIAGDRRRQQIGLVLHRRRDTLPPGRRRHQVYAVPTSRDAARASWRCASRDQQVRGFAELGARTASISQIS